MSENTSNSNIQIKLFSEKKLWWHDTLLIGVMAILAACGLIYEYLLSHYAGRVLGAMESAIYAMIGTMIVAMGIGAFLARNFKDSFTTFAWLETLVAFLGMSSVLIIASLIALTHQFPQLLSEYYGLPSGYVLDGISFSAVQDGARYLPYVFGLILGIAIGMEIPLIARIRHAIHQNSQVLEHNAGTIYGADYIGAGIGAAIWVSIMLSLPLMQAAAWTALFNLIAGLFFVYQYRRLIRKLRALIVTHILLFGLFFILLFNGQMWLEQLGNLLYKDKVIYSHSSHYQHIVLTERHLRQNPKPVTDLYLNGRLQFSSIDEHIYHEMLVVPAMLASNRHDRVLIIGGGDGLALRDVLKWPVKEVTLVDLDGQLLDLFGNQSKQYQDIAPLDLKQRLTELNEQAFSDTRVSVDITDAFLAAEQLVAEGRYFDTIIVDLPDPNHPDLNKLYSDYFYSHIKSLLAPDGALAIQSTSPYHAKNAFLSIGKTLKLAGFKHIDQYHQNVPSFGQWGWTLATKKGQSGLNRIKNNLTIPVTTKWVTLELIEASFVFPHLFFEQLNQVNANRLGTATLYRYYSEAWENESELYNN